MKRLILTAAILFSLAGILSADDGKSPDPNKLFYSANSLYEKHEYALALEDYNKISDLGYYSAYLYYNMANAYFKSGKLGRAILFYEKAKRLMPQDSDLKTNLDYVKSLVQAQVAEPNRRNIVIRLLKAPFRDFSLNTIAISALIFYLLFIALMITAIFNPVFAKKAKAIYAVVFLLFAVLAAVFAVRYYDEEIIRRGVVVEKNVECKYEPIDKSSEFFKLAEGQRVSIINTRDDWRQVRGIDGKAGWVKQDMVEEI